jgi:hypothetical protein
VTPEPTTMRPAPATRRRRQRPPAITARDLAAVRWVGEQFGARADLLAVLLGRLSPSEPQAAGLVGARTVRHHVDRWLRARLVVREHLLGHTWVTPTRRGLSMAGLDFPLWELPETQLGHVHAVGVVRLAVEQAGGTWVCERHLRRELASPVAHPFDGAVQTEAGRYLVEVELTQKAQRRVTRAVAASDGALSLTYFTSAELLAAIGRQVATAEAELRGRGRQLPLIRVLPLPSLEDLVRGGAA